MIPAAGLWMTRNLDRGEPLSIPSVGEWRTEEVRVLIIFGLTALAWITLREPFGGWSLLFGLPSANYAAVALTSVVLMFVLPNGHGGKLLDWESASTIHWGVLLLFAGGIAIAKAFAVTGISEAIGESLSGVTRLSHYCDYCYCGSVCDFSYRDNQQYSHHHIIDAHSGRRIPGGGH